MIELMRNKYKKPYHVIYTDKSRQPRRIKGEHNPTITLQ